MVRIARYRRVMSRHWFVPMRAQFQGSQGTSFFGCVICCTEPRRRVPIRPCTFLTPEACSTFNVYQRLTYTCKAPKIFICNYYYTSTTGCFCLFCLFFFCSAHLTRQQHMNTVLPGINSIFTLEFSDKTSYVRTRCTWMIPAPWLGIKFCTTTVQVA